MKTRKQSHPMSDEDDDDYDQNYDYPDRFSGFPRRTQVRSCRVEKRRITRRTSSRTRVLEESPSSSLDESLPSPPPSPPQQESSSAQSKKARAASPSLQAPSDTCNFCKTNNSEVYELGELKKCENITAHLYCLFFAPGLTQNGQTNEGIDGFLLPDIRKELRRATQLRCSFCNKRGSAVGCGVASCSANFHLPCGLNNGVFTQFHDPNQSFPAFCKRHRPKYTLPSFQGTVMCTICQENAKFSVDRSKLLFLSCCQTYFHRSCLSQLAYFHGEHSLKCPNCKNVKDFIPHLKTNGIYVPFRDFLPDADDELITVNENTWVCSAVVCNCENGRNHNGDNEWELFACDQCGSNAVHIACAGLSEGSEWSCEICSNVV